MRSIGIHRLKTFARTGLLATLLLGYPRADCHSQEPGEPSGTGVQQPSNEELIERANKSSVQADAIWIEITKVGRDASRWVMDLNRKGSCYVIRDEDGQRIIYGGGAIPPGLVKRVFTSLTRRSVIYSDRVRPPSQSHDQQLVAIGMATWDGSRVYKTQSGALESYPEDVQKLIAELRTTVDQLAVSAEAMGSIQSTFLRPNEARRMLEGGKRIVTVEDPGKDARELSTLEMAIRLPGRDIVVPTSDDWGALETYVVASNPEDPDSGEFYVKSSARIYRVKMTKAEGSSVGRDGLEDELIPRAKPVGQ